MARVPSKTTPSSSSSTKSISKAKSKSKSLRTGRPPLLSSTATASSTGGPRQVNTPTTASISSKHTRSLIRQHHVLHKRLAAARAQNDDAQVRDLEAQIAAQGGLKTYQLASQVGQSAERGGDSSRVLVQWLREEIEMRRPRGKAAAADTGDVHMGTVAADATAVPPPPPPLRILEVGALSTTNALNVRGATVVRRIDLRSSGPGIEEMDFMDLPVPDEASGTGEWADGWGYDVLSLSLVLNYVPDAAARGHMLKRTTLFFSPSPPLGHSQSESHPQPESDMGQDKAQQTSSSGRLLPCLFLVLPSPTLHNSRYLTPQHLDDILQSLGYVHIHTKTTRKLHYSLWGFDRARRDEINNRNRRRGEIAFPKKEINPGKGRNNFCIVL